MSGPYNFHLRRVAASLFALALFLGCRPPAGPVSDSISAGPAIEVPRTVDLGVQDLHHIISARFRIANRGSEVLEVRNIRTNCSCSSLEADSGGGSVKINALDVPPGASQEVSLSLRIEGRSGSRLLAAIVFATNDPGNPEVQVDLIVPRIRAGLRAEPPDAIVGSVDPQPEIRRDIALFDDSELPRTIERVVSSRPEIISAKVIPPSEGQIADPATGRCMGTLQVTIRAARPGSLEAEVLVIVAGEPDRPTRVRVHGRVNAPVEVSPETVMLPRRSTDGWVYSTACVVRRSDGRLFALTPQEVPKGMTCVVTGERSHQIVTLTITQPSAGEFAVRLVARIGDQSWPVVIPIRVREVAK